VLPTLLSLGIQLASSPYVADADPKRNLLWDDNSISDSFIIGAGLLILIFVLGCLTVFSWLIYLLLAHEFPARSGKLGRTVLLGVLGSVVGLLLTYHYASLQAFGIPCVAGLLITGTLAGFFTGKTKQVQEPPQ